VCPLIFPRFAPPFIPKVNPCEKREDEKNKSTMMKGIILVFIFIIFKNSGLK
jgi:hypothetical protein